MLTGMDKRVQSRHRWSQRWGIADAGHGRARRDAARAVVEKEICDHGSVCWPGTAADKDGRRNAIDDARALSNKAMSTTTVVLVVNVECGSLRGTKNRDGSGAQVCRHVQRVKHTVQQRVSLECVRTSGSLEME